VLGHDLDRVANVPFEFGSKPLHLVTIAALFSAKTQRLKAEFKTGLIGTFEPAPFIKVA
jgi:hypothetical protein